MNRALTRVGCLTPGQLHGRRGARVPLAGHFAGRPDDLHLLHPYAGFLPPNSAASAALAAWKQPDRDRRRAGQDQANLLNQLDAKVVALNAQGRAIQPATDTTSARHLPARPTGPSDRSPWPFRNRFVHELTSCLQTQQRHAELREVSTAIPAHSNECYGEPAVPNSGRLRVMINTRSTSRKTPRRTMEETDKTASSAEAQIWGRHLTAAKILNPQGAEDHSRGIRSLTPLQGRPHRLSRPPHSAR